MVCLVCIFINLVKLLFFPFLVVFDHKRLQGEDNLIRSEADAKRLRLFQRGWCHKAQVHDGTDYFTEADATRLRYMTEQIISQRRTPQGSGKRRNRIFQRGCRHKAQKHDGTDFFREADTTSPWYMTKQNISQRLTPQGSDLLTEADATRL
ncbi:hypothetical protein RRG08_046382, partial [Elysia crispata]